MVEPTTLALVLGGKAGCFPGYFGSTTGPPVELEKWTTVDSNCWFNVKNHASLVQHLLILFYLVTLLACHTFQKACSYPELGFLLQAIAVFSCKECQPLTVRSGLLPSRQITSCKNWGKSVPIQSPPVNWGSKKEKKNGCKQSILGYKARVTAPCSQKHANTGSFHYAKKESFLRLTWCHPILWLWLLYSSQAISSVTFPM